MNLAELMVSDPGKPTAKKIADPSKSDDGSQSEFAKFVTDQSEGREDPALESAPKDTNGTSTETPEVNAAPLASGDAPQGDQAAQRSATAGGGVESVAAALGIAAARGPVGSDGSGTETIESPVADQPQSTKRSVPGQAALQSVAGDFQGERGSPQHTTPQKTAATPEVDADTPTQASSAPKAALIASPQPEGSVPSTQGPAAEQPRPTIRPERTAEASRTNVTAERANVQTPTGNTPSGQAVATNAAVAQLPVEARVRSTPARAAKEDLREAPGRLITDREAAPAKDTDQAVTNKASQSAQGTTEPVSGLQRRRPGNAIARPTAIAGAELQFGATTNLATNAAPGQIPVANTTLATLDPRVIAQHIAPQVVNAVAARAPGTAIDITLDPPELGRIEIVLDFAESGLRASLTVERGSTNDLLRRHAELLSEHFEEAGFSDVDLSFSDKGTDGSESGTVLGAFADAQDTETVNAQSDGQKIRQSTRLTTGPGIDVLL